MAVLVLIFSSAAQSAFTVRYILKEILGLSVLTIAILSFIATCLGTVLVYFMQLLGASAEINLFSAVITDYSYRLVDRRTNRQTDRLTDKLIDRQTK